PGDCMDQSPPVIRAISWRDLFPWLILLRTFRIAISPTLLALAAAAIVISPLGWGVASFIFRPGDGPVGDWRSRIPRAENSQLTGYVPSAVTVYFPAHNAIVDTYFDLAEPVTRFFQL